MFACRASPFARVRTLGRVIAATGMRKSVMAIILQDVTIAMHAYLQELDFSDRRPGPGEAEKFAEILTYVAARQPQAACAAFFKLREPTFQKDVAGRPVLVTTTDHWREKLNDLGH